jgi:regulator of protease activity HflC (stomatin/prohibitin superfamily)
MEALRYLLLAVGVGLFGGAGILLVYDLFLVERWGRFFSRGKRKDERDAGTSLFAEGGSPTGAPGGAAGSTGSPSGGAIDEDNRGLGARETRAGNFVAAPFRRPVRWGLAGRLVACGVVAILVGESFVVVPDGTAGVRVSELWGVRPGTLYPGLHWVTPLVDSVAIYDTREQVYTTVASESAKATDAKTGRDGGAGRDGGTNADGGGAMGGIGADGTRGDGSQSAKAGGADVLTVQAREGLNIGLAVTVRYRLDARDLVAIHRNLPRPVGAQVVGPVVSAIYRQLAPTYLTREIFATRREELRSKAAELIVARLATDGILVREVLLRDLVLPAEYAKGLEGLLLKEQENERLGTEQEIKAKEVKIAELEGEAQKARDVKAAEAAAQVHVLQAKSESDAMQYTLPLKQKQIEQSKLEAQARKESTLQNAEAAAQAKVIDSKAEVERQKNLSEAEANRIRVTAAADSERMKFEASVLKSNPMLIQKIIAERLSDKLQIMMVPIDGKNFFANDVMRSAFSGVAASKDNGAEDDSGDSPAANPTSTTTAQRKVPRQQ